MYNIAFPGFNLYFNINRVAFNIFGKDIFWYGIIIVIAVLICLSLRKRDRNEYGIPYDIVEQFVLWVLPFSIVGARIYYVVFTWEEYEDKWADIIKIWNGGLAIYGGIIAAIITGIIFCRIKKVNVIDLFDSVVPYLALGQAIGRWGNFVNREAYGSSTDSIFRMEILTEYGKYISVHPTFLYESLGLILIFTVLKINKRKFSGEQTALYFFGYGILRFFVEYLRSDSLMMGNIKVSMFVSVIAIIASGIIIIKWRRKI